MATIATAVTPLVSVIINNFNYARYLGRAIQSVLDQSYAPIEVIVVDDGSTDESRQVAASFGSRITTVFKANGGHGSTFNAGFAVCRGDLIFFLDADDFYTTATVARAVAAFTAKTAMVQFRLQLVDEHERVQGVYPPPSVRFQRGNVVSALLREARFIGTVTTGNGFRRQVLEELLPLPEAELRQAADGYLINAAPFFGEVAAIDEPIACYRRHGSNDSSMIVPAAVKLAQIRKRLGFVMNEVGVIRAQAIKRGLVVPTDLAERNIMGMVLRMASFKLAPGSHPLAGDRAWRLAFKGMQALLRGRQEQLRRNAIKYFFWFPLIAGAPARLVPFLVDVALSDDSVPGIREAKAALRALRSRVKGEAKRI